MWRFFYLYAFFVGYTCLVSLLRQRKRWKALPPAPDGLEIVVFENGLCGFWNKGSAGNRLAVVSGTTFRERHAHYRVLQEVFVGYDVLFLDLSEPSEKAVSDVVGACGSLARFRPWQEVGFIGIEEGCLVQSAVATALRRRASRLMPAWIVQFNGFTSLASWKDFHGSVWPPGRRASLLDSRPHLSALSCPIILFHNKASASSPLTESVRLHLHLGERSALVLLFGHDEYFLFSKENKAIITGKLREHLRPEFLG
jgi:hypothetical protein